MESNRNSESSNENDFPCVNQTELTITVDIHTTENTNFSNNQPIASTSRQPENNVLSSDNKLKNFQLKSSNNSELKTFLQSYVKCFVKTFEEQLDEFIIINETEESVENARSNLNQTLNKSSDVNHIIEAFRELKLSNIDEFRKILVEVSGDIFKTFENEIVAKTKVNGGESTDELAINAVNRFLNYVNDRNKIKYGEISLGELRYFLIEGVIVGGSEGRSTTLADINITNGIITNVTNIFDGATVIKINENTYEYQIKKGFQLKESKFGLQFSNHQQVSNHNDKIHKIQQREDIKALSIQEHNHQLKVIFDNINNQDTNKIINDKLAPIHQFNNDILESNIKTNEKVIELQESIIEVNDSVKVIENKLNQTNFIQSKSAIWFDIILPVKSFIGRDKELQNLHKILTTKNSTAVISQAASITGFGGIGKSETSRMYVEKYKEFYHNAIWINSETNESITDSFVKLATILKIPVEKIIIIKDDKNSKKVEKSEKIDVKLIANEIYKYCGMLSTLIIFDNAEEYSDIKEILPQSLPSNYQKPSVLITSRNNNWKVDEDDGEIKVIELELFTSEEAINYIKKTLEKTHLDDEVIKLAKELGFYPLGLKQAVSYINVTNKKRLERDEKSYAISDYLNEFQSEAIKVERLHFTTDHNRYEKTVMTTWNVTIKKISENTEALKIIQMMSFMSPDFKSFFKLFNRLVKDKNELWDAIDLLQKYSLIAFDRKTDVASIHRLLQFAIRNQLKMNGEDIKVLVNSLELLKSYYNLCYSIKGYKYLDNSQIENLMIVIGFASDYDILIKKIYKNVYQRKNTSLHLMARCGNVKAIKKIVEYIERERPHKLNYIINKNDNVGYSPLDIAIENGHLNVIKYLKENEATVIDDSIRHAVQHFQIDIIKILNPLNLNYHLFYANLFYGSKRDNLDQLNKFYNEINQSDKENLIQLFNDNLNSNKYKYNFWFQEIFKSVKIMQFLIENNFQKNLYVVNVIVLIKYTIKYDHPIEIFKELVDECPDKNSLVEGERTLLHCAVHFKRFFMVKYLIENGADVNAVDKNKETILQLAYQNSNLEMIKYLIENGGKVDLQDNNTILHLVAKNNDSNVISYFLSDKFNQNLDINATDSKGKTPIIVAVLNKNIEVFQCLLNKKNELNIKTTLTFTFSNYPETTVSLLHLAVAADAVDIVKLIIEQDGINVIENNIVDGINVNGLHLAVLFRSEDVIKHLTELNKLFKKKINKIENDFDKKGIKCIYLGLWWTEKILKFYKMTSELLHKR